MGTAETERGVLALADELKQVTLRRLGETFKDPARNDQERFETLVRIVSSLEHEIWREDPTRALIVVMRRAVGLLPEEYPNAKHSGDSAITWRAIGQLLCGFRNGVGSTYKDYLAVMKEETQLFCSPKTFDRSITVLFRQRLAQILLEMEEHAKAQPAQVGQAGSVLPQSDAIVPLAESSEPAGAREPNKAPLPKATAELPHQRNFIRPLDDGLQRALTALAGSLHARYLQEERQWQVHEPSSLLPLRWVNAPDEIVDHWQNIRGDGAADPIDLSGSGGGDELRDIFRAVPSRRMVVLGDAGTGKSLLAVRFALALLDPEHRQPDYPLPAICKLAHWDVARQGFREWLVGQLAGLLPTEAGTERRAQASKLLTSGHILPILDGFDELNADVRAQAIRAINAGLNRGEPVLVTSRAAAYADAVESGIDGPRKVLPGAAVVQLQPLDLNDVMAYLELTAAKFVVDGKPVTKWQPVFEALRHESDHPGVQALAQVLTTPLMVAMARMTYSETDDDPQELLTHGEQAGLVDVPEQLLHRFTVAACSYHDEDRAGKRVRPRWPTYRALRYLGNLALQLHRSWEPSFEWWSSGQSGTAIDYRLAPLPWVTSWLGFVLILRASLSIPLLLMHAAIWLLICFLLTPFHERDGFVTAWRLPGTLLPVLVVSQQNRRVLHFAAAVTFVGLLPLAFVLPVVWLVGPLFLLIVTSLMLPHLHDLEIETPLDEERASSPAWLLKQERNRLAWFIPPLFMLCWVGIAAFGWGIYGRFSVNFVQCLVALDVLIVPVFASTWGRWLLVRTWFALTRLWPWSIIGFLADMHDRGVLRREGPAYIFRHNAIHDYLAVQALKEMSERALSRRENLGARNNLGVSLAESGRLDAGIRELRSALKMSRMRYGDQEHITAILWANALDFDYSDGRAFDPDVAVTELREMLTMATNRVLRGRYYYRLRCWIRLVRVLEHAGHRDEACEELSALLSSIEPDTSSASKMRELIIRGTEDLAAFEALQPLPKGPQ